MLATTLARFLLSLMDIATLPFRLVIALLSGHRFQFRYFSRPQADTE